MESYYNTISKSYNALHQKEQEKKLELIKKTWHPKGIILDIGCGTNIANRYFKSIIGLDKSFSMLNSGINVCSMAESLPFKDKSFDAILCLTAIHNFNDIKKAVKEMKRVLKKDQIVISILKKSGRFKHIKGIITKEFDFYCIEEEKDIIFISP